MEEKLIMKKIDKMRGTIVTKHLLLVAVLWEAVVWDFGCLIPPKVWECSHTIDVLALAVFSATYCKFIYVRN